MHASSRACIDSSAALRQNSVRAIKASRKLIYRSELLGLSCPLCRGQLRAGDNLTAHVGQIAHDMCAEITRRGSRRGVTE